MQARLKIHPHQAQVGDVFSVSGAVITQIIPESAYVKITQDLNGKISERIYYKDKYIYLRRNLS